MVLESLLNPTRPEHRPFSLLIIGFVYATVGLFLGLWIFEEYASMIMIFLTVMAAIPLIFATITFEEEKDDHIEKETTLLREHAKALSVFFFFFLGSMVAFTLWYVVLPSSVSSLAFLSQSKTIVDLNQQITGNIAEQIPLFMKIIMNNVKVLIFCILFSFVYGTGAIFILTWNASVIGVALGNFIRTNLSQYALSHGFEHTGTYLYVVSLSLARYMVHGIPEIVAYILGGLAGGIISVAAVKHRFETKKFFHVLLDAADLLIISLAVLLIAGLLEVFVTPLLI